MIWQFSELGYDINQLLRGWYDQYELQVGSQVHPLGLSTGPATAAHL
jgi:hypothetical protein